MNKNIENFIKLTFLVLLILLQGCASLSSTKIFVGGKKEAIQGVADGVVYFMPKRPIRITYSIAQNKNDKNKSDIAMSVDDTNFKDMTPDASNMFILKYNKNYVGKNHMYIDVDRNGLLSVSHADTLSRLNEIIQNAGKDAAAISFGAAPQLSTTSVESNNTIDHSNESYFKKLSTNISSNPTSVAFTTNEKCTPGSYSKLINPDENGIFKGESEGEEVTIGSNRTCRLNIKIKRAFDPSIEKLKSNRLGEDSDFNWIMNTLDVFHSHNSGNSLPGLFYKEEKPYRIVITTIDAEYSLTALSPNESAIYFAPISKTLFANNTSDISLSYGVIRTIEETTDSEIWAASKAPSDFVGSYTDAALKGLQNLNLITDSEATLLDKKRALSESQANYELLQAERLAKIKKELAEANKSMVDSQINLTNSNAKKEYCEYLLSLAKGKNGDALKKAIDNYNAACASK